MSGENQEVVWFGYDPSKSLVFLKNETTNEYMEKSKDTLIELASQLPNFIKSLYEDQPKKMNSPESTGSDWIALKSEENELKLTLKRSSEPDNVNSEKTEWKITKWSSDEWPASPSEHLFEEISSDCSEVIEIKEENDTDDDGGIQILTGIDHMPNDPMGWLRAERTDRSIGRWITRTEWDDLTVSVDIMLHLSNEEISLESAVGRNEKLTKRKAAEQMIRTIATRRRNNLPVI